MIPKIVHQIWVGDKVIPEEFLSFSDKWKFLYRDFEYKLWNDNDVILENIIPPNIFPYYTDNTFALAFKADLLRYHILQKFGGIYVDMDMEPLKRMDDYIFELTFFSGMQSNGEVNISIIGSESNNKLINETCYFVVDNIKKCIRDGIPKTEIQKFTGPEYFTEICKYYYNTNGYKFFEPKYFYPYWFLEPERRYENFEETCPDAYSVHHWTQSWRS
jgi:mannosyltransferase OCH1-like enzyme